MEIKEMRIGNLYHWHAESEYYVYELEVKDFASDNYKNFYPIPLTEQWMIKFKAEVFEFDNGEPNQYRIGNRLFVIRNGKIVDYGTNVILEYVHRFQNFMFEVTNEELIWNE